MDVGSERRDDDAAVGIFRKEMFERRSHDLFAHRIAGALDVGGFSEIEKHALFAVFGDLRKVDGLAGNGRQIDLEVAAVEDDPVRRLDGERHGSCDGVIDIDEVDREAPGLDAVLGSDGVLDHVVQAVLAELVVDERQGQFGSIDRRRRIEFLHEIRNAADVVFVAVRQKDAADLILVLDKIGDVGEHEVDARHLLGRENDARVDDDDVVPVLDGGHVLADLADTAEEEHFDGPFPFPLLHLLFRLLGSLCGCGSRGLFSALFGLLCIPALCGRFLCRLFLGLGFGELGPFPFGARTALGLQTGLFHCLFAEERFVLASLLLLLGGSIARILLSLFAVIRLDAVQNGKLDGAPSFALFFFLQKILLCPQAQQRREKRPLLPLFPILADVLFGFLLIPRSA